MDFGLAGKRVLVTGATAGIGFGVAELFAKYGAEVLINGRGIANVEKAINRINAVKHESAKLVPAVGDVSTAEGCAELIKLVDSLGELDVLVCNVGIYEVKPFGEISDDDWQRLFDVNVMSCVRLTRHFLPKMLARNTGRVILISSECGARPIPHMVHYSMTKSAQISLARGLAENTKGTNVTVNSVLPGPTATEGLRDYFAGLAAQKGITPEQAEKEYFKVDEPTSLIQRLATVEEVASVVVFLASRQASAINGAAQKVEGGIIRVQN
eukprot:Colp12_sorted_trinity150504_noHs@10825